jgi:hypothetical protein
MKEWILKGNITILTPLLRSFALFLDTDVEIILVHSVADKSKIRVWFEDNFGTHKSPYYTRKVQFIYPEMEKKISKPLMSICNYLLLSDKSILKLKKLIGDNRAMIISDELTSSIISLSAVVSR